MRDSRQSLCELGNDANVDCEVAWHDRDLTVTCFLLRIFQGVPLYVMWHLSIHCIFDVKNQNRRIRPLRNRFHQS